MLPSTLLFTFASFVSAFPSHESKHAARESLRKRTVDVTGEHAWQAPEAGFARGPCPGLNALANHGYIPRNGIVSLTEVIEGVTGVYNMGLDMTTVIGLMGVLWAGDPLQLSFSIGGPQDGVGAPLGGLLGLFGQPQGLDYSHNFIEADSSIARNDILDTGDAWSIDPQLLQQLLDFVPEGQSYTNDVLASFAAFRFNQSIHTSPYFWYGPFTGFIARNSGYNFFSRLLSDHSDGTVDGVLNHTVIKSFYGVDELTGQPISGYERIPEGFTSRPIPYGLMDLNLDLIKWLLQHPELGSMGGNLGKVNTFAPFDLQDPIRGLKNAPNFLEGNNFICFALQFFLLASPTYFNNFWKTIEPMMQVLGDVASQLTALDCPSWDLLTQGGQPLWDELQAFYPGAKNSSM